jgi:transposase
MSITDAAADRPATPSAEQLPNDVAALKSMVLELMATLHQERRDHEAVRYRLDLLLRRLYGPRGERFDPNQPLLFAEAAADASPSTPPPAPAPEKTKRRCRPHGRRRLPPNLPRESRHHELPAAARLCPDCGQARADIGVDKSEQLDYRPASLRVIEHFVHKYACPCCRKGPLPGPSLQQHQSGAPRLVPDDQAPSTRTTAPPESLSMATPNTPAAANPPVTDADQPAPAAAEASSALVPPAGVVVSAVKPVAPIAKGLPGPGLLAHLIVSKCVDHLPLHRLERIYERQGVFLPRSTLCDWMAASAQLLGPLYQALVDVVLASRVLHTDDTPVDMQDRERHLITARLWVYLGDREHPYNVFDFTPNHKRDGPQRFLAPYRGYLQADAFTGYDCLYLPDARDGVARIVEVACNAHARRKFYEARTSDDLRAHVALGYYRSLYELERQAQGYDDAIRLRIRQDLAVPILEQFHAWLEQEHVQVLPKSPMGEAIGYALNQWTALRRYTEASCLAIDNNVAEREMKKIAIGRKNWLFVGSEQGGRTAAVLFSFTSTCQRLGIEPWAYLQDVLSRLPTTPSAALAELLPDRWQAARRAQPASPPVPSAAASPSAE